MSELAIIIDAPNCEHRPHKSYCMKGQAKALQQKPFAWWKILVDREPLQKTKFLSESRVRELVRDASEV